MREIKFRAWDIENGILEYIDDLYWFEENGIKDFSGKAIHTEYIYTQYIGLKDENGKEIYEGDIARVFHEDGYEVVGQVEWGLSSKRFGIYPAFAIAELESEMNSFSEIFDTGQYTIEVIGNIFENPELLEDDDN